MAWGAVRLPAQVRRLAPQSPAIAYGDGLAGPRASQVLIRQIAQNVGVDRVRVESGLVLFEAQAPQPTPDVHDRDCGQALRHLPGYTAACPGH